MFLNNKPSWDVFEVSSANLLMSLKTKLNPWPAIGCIACRPSPRIRMFFLKYFIFFSKHIPVNFIDLEGKSSLSGHKINLSILFKIKNYSLGYLFAHLLYAHT